MEWNSGEDATSSSFNHSLSESQKIDRPQETSSNFHHCLYHQSKWFVGKCPMAALKISCLQKPTPLPISARETTINLWLLLCLQIWYKILENVIGTQASGPFDSGREHGRTIAFELPTSKPTQFPCISLFIFSLISQVCSILILVSSLPVIAIMIVE